MRNEVEFKASKKITPSMSARRALYELMYVFGSNTFSYLSQPTLIFPDLTYTYLT